jgi:2-oxo-hept-3-ene-1,7-dioate hydratase
VTGGPTSGEPISEGASGEIAEEAVRAEAALLDEADRSATQVRQTTMIYPAMTLDEAYRVQAAWQDLRVGRGEVLVGHKIGLTSRAMQQAMRIDTPDSGFLTDAMVFAPDIELGTDAFTDPKVEVELAFVLGRDLTAEPVGPDLTIDDVLAATEYVTPAVELLAARSHRIDPDTGRTRTVIDTVADNAADAGIVCGGEPVGPRDVDLRWVGAVLSRNGIVEETGLAAGVLGHPALGIVWLARRYAEQGLSLRAGQTILAGSFTRPVDVRPGDQFAFDYGPLGRFTLGFT